MTADRTDVIYLGGTGRSGSTLLAELLGAHRGLLAVGELRYVWERSLLENQSCGCGVPFRSCPFWAEVMTKAFGGLQAAEALDVPRLANEVDRLRFTLPLASSRLRSSSFDQNLAEFGDILRSLYDAVLSVAGGDVVVDSSKDPSYAYVLCALDQFDVTLVHLVRDSRAVAHSWTREKVRPEIHWKVEHMRRRKPAQSAVAWVRINALIDALAHRHDSATRLRYEDLVLDPDRAVATVMALLDSSPALVEGEPFNHSVSGNPIRFERAARVIRGDFAWQSEMSERDRRVVTAISYPLLRRYGYRGLTSSVRDAR